MKKNYRKFKLFGEVWSIGKCSKIPTGQWHSVIKNNGKEYHVYDKIALSLRIGESPIDRADIEKTKLYIITEILDKNDWKFDLKEIPKNGSNIKVIYKGITVKWITFNESWDNHKLLHKTKEAIAINTDWDYTKLKSQFLWEERVNFKNIIAWRYGKEN